MESVEVAGETVLVLDLPEPVQARYYSHIRVAMVSDSVDELMSRQCYLDAAKTMLTSVKRRAITPKGCWGIGFLPVDDPDWGEPIKEPIRAQIAAKLAEEPDLHVRVFALLDTGDPR